ncbi:MULTISPECIES: transglycosylase SLT domain-containing protein [Halomonas]|uniref:transglycosylase SLT domain-containing protein n=1 Tax=Halomonas TaxID=2745 RepID=UPI001868F47C|nr:MULTISPECIES: transglycosylase SLT domain-containing protein [Halomonas]
MPNAYRLATIILLLLALSPLAHADQAYLACLTDELKGSEAAYDEYVSALNETTTLFDIAPAIMVAIKLTESGRSLNANVTNHNNNGTIDRGYYQVNADVWLPVMRDLGLQVSGEDMHDVRSNSLMAGWVLRRQLNRFPDSPYKGVGHYHRGGGTSDHANAIRSRYMSKFMAHLRRLAARCH